MSLTQGNQQLRCDRCAKTAPVRVIRAGARMPQRAVSIAGRQVHVALPEGWGAMQVLTSAGLQWGVDLCSDCLLFLEGAHFWAPPYNRKDHDDETG